VLGAPQHQRGDSGADGGRDEHGQGNRAGDGERGHEREELAPGIGVNCRQRAGAARRFKSGPGAPKMAHAVAAAGAIAPGP
jgi:hypothetical protein